VTVDLRRKEPAESLDYGIDWSSALVGAEIIATAQFVATPAGLTVGAVAHTDTVSTVRLSGGVAGQEYEVEGTITTSGGNTIVESFILQVEDEGATVTGERYCTTAQARAQGAQGSTRDVDLAIVAATSRIDSYTGDRFTPRLMTVVARVGGDGRAMLPYRLTTTASVTAVVDQDTGTDLTAGVFRAYSSAVPGEVDAIGLGRRHVGNNILVNGLEPWSDLGSFGVQRVAVTATFGWSTTPDLVAQACAVLAAHLAKDTAQAAVTSTADAADPEGNVIPVVPPFTSEQDQPATEAEAGRTTGLRQVDAMLTTYRRYRLLTGV
jgi:hypothetical protein